MLTLLIVNLFVEIELGFVDLKRHLSLLGYAWLF